MRRYLEAGRLNSPRGIKGELRFACWCDSPEFLEGVRTFYLDAEGMRPLRVVLYRPSIPSLIFEGYEDRSRASQLVNRTIYFDREDVPLPEGVVYNDDLLGLPVFDTDGARLGSLTAVEEGVRGMYYVVTGGEKSYPGRGRVRQARVAHRRRRRRAHRRAGAVSAPPRHFRARAVPFCEF